jgi:hypothetical protein
MLARNPPGNEAGLFRASLGILEQDGGLKIGGSLGSFIARHLKIGEGNGEGNEHEVAALPYGSKVLFNGSGEPEFEIAV